MKHISHYAGAAKNTVTKVIKNQFEDGFVLKDWLELLAFVCFVVVPIRLFIFQPFIVSGYSMYPTFDDKDYIIVDEVTYRLDRPKRGDVIVLRYPLQPDEFFIKRIIGLPGEKISIRGGRVYITETSGRTVELSEDYVKRISIENFDATIATDEYFVMGDNRSGSSDSRIWGTVPKNKVVGRAIVRLFPFKEATFFPGKNDPAFENLADIPK